VVNQRGFIANPDGSLVRGAIGGGGGTDTVLQLDGGSATSTYSIETMRFDMGSST
jgi:hypothetical protein